jgi:hypothetical protein
MNDPKVASLPKAFHLKLNTESLWADADAPARNGSKTN